MTPGKKDGRTLELIWFILEWDEEGDLTDKDQDEVANNATVSDETVRSCRNTILNCWRNLKSRDDKLSKRCDCYFSLCLFAEIEIAWRGVIIVLFPSSAEQCLTASSLCVLSRLLLLAFAFPAILVESRSSRLQRFFFFILFCSLPGRGLPVLGSFLLNIFDGDAEDAFIVKGPDRQLHQEQQLSHHVCFVLERWAEREIRGL